VGDGTGAGAVVAARVGTGVGATAGGRVATGCGDFPVGTGTGVAVPGLPVTGLAIGTGDLYLVGVGGAVGTADGAALRGTGAAVGVDVARTEADGTGAAAVGVAVAVAEAAAAPCVSWVAGALTACDAPDEAAAVPDVEAAPEQPVSASPAATPSPVTHSTGPDATNGVFDCDRICFSCRSSDDHFSTGKYGATGEKLCREGSNLSPRSPVYAHAGSSCRAKA
jgi:hypothetical protein